MDTVSVWCIAIQQMVLYVKKKTAAPSIYMLATLYTLWFADLRHYDGAISK